MELFAVLRVSSVFRIFRLPAFALLFALLLGGPAFSAEEAKPTLPPATLHIPAMVKEKSVSTYLPSPAAPGQGLAVNVIYPVLPRYKDGAPVVVIVPGAETRSGLDFSMHASQSGFVEVRFAFPGGGSPEFSSGGAYDAGGQHCRQALCDVLRFAGGELADREGRKINELVPVKLWNPVIGAVGWSNGGNLLLTTMETYPKLLPGLAWIAFYESPLGELMYPPCLGSAKDLHLNPFYKVGSAAQGQVKVDFRRLRYEEGQTKNPGHNKRLGLPEVKGVVFHDQNNNKVWEESLEYAYPYCLEPDVEKQFYPPSVTQALTGLYKKPEQWPAKVATYAEASAYFKERDGYGAIPVVAAAYPKLMVSVFASYLDHGQRQPDHPHIWLQYKAWRAAKTGWLRLNPDPVYLATLSGLQSDNFKNNPINTDLQGTDLDPYLEPEGLLPDYVFMQATIAELSDRRKANKMIEVLAAPIVDYKNGAEPLNPANTKKPAADSKTGSAGKAGAKADKK